MGLIASATPGGAMWKRVGALRVALLVGGLLVALAASLAGTMVWLYLTDPVTVAELIDEGALVALARRAAVTLFSALANAVRML